jgi:two-component system cell cycle response regulator DivK
MSLILCVEDDQASFFVLHRRLTRAGHEVKVATNGLEGVDWAKKLQPALIVMDLNLPKLNGWEATRRLKDQPETKHIPIIILSSHADKGSHDKAIAAGCDLYHTKPADFRQLVEQIETLLKGTPAS